MSNFTTEVRFICESFSGLSESKGYTDVDEIIENARGKIFTNYPIFNEEYRQTLEHKILEHYYTREIGFETVGLWKLKLNAKMKEIMPYYNKLYESELLQFDPFNDVDLTTTHKRQEKGNNDSISNIKEKENEKNILGTQKQDVFDKTTKDDGHNSNTNRYSDTPQGGLNGMTDIENNIYLTNATIDNGANDNTNTEKGTITTINSGTDIKDKAHNSINNNHSNFNTDEDIEEKITGKRGSNTYSYLLKEYRDTFLNIDMMIIEELKDLFMLIWE